LFYHQIVVGNQQKPIPGKILQKVRGRKKKRSAVPKLNAERGLETRLPQKLKKKRKEWEEHGEEQTRPYVGKKAEGRSEGDNPTLARRPPVT